MQTVLYFLACGGFGYRPKSWFCLHKVLLFSVVVTMLHAEQPPLSVPTFLRRCSINFHPIITPLSLNKYFLTPTFHRALRHHINPTSSDATGITEIAGGISVPLPDLTKAELNACLTTLRNVNIMLLMPIVYFIDLTPHGIQHSRLSQKFMSIKGLLITECKDVIIESALRTTEVEPPSRPCLSFNRYPTSGADGMAFLLFIFC